MKKINQKTVSYLAKRGSTGDLGKIEIADDLKISDLNIRNCEFMGLNKIFGPTDINKSTIKDSVLFANTHIYHSIVVDSIIADNVIIENYSRIADTVVSSLSIPGEKSVSIFPVWINNSQIEGDVILGGSDFSQTRSRGGSIFAFAHIGGGEFKESLIFGTPQTAQQEDNLVEIGHFGYYGSLNVLSLAVHEKNGGSFSPDGEDLYNALENALKNIYFMDKLGQKIEVTRGRSNFGAGTTVSNYDPVRNTKAGAIFLLSSTGTNVVISPYLFVMPNSLIASGSTDITRITNVIAENSLVIARSQMGILLDGYYDETRLAIMNDRSPQEIAFQLQYLRFLKVLAQLSTRGIKSAKSGEAVAWGRSLEKILKLSQKRAKKNLPDYFEKLKKSVAAIDKRIADKPAERPKLKAKAKIQEGALRGETAVLNEAVTIHRFIEGLSKVNDPEKLLKAAEGKGSVLTSEQVSFTKKQILHLKSSLVEIK